MTRRLWQGLSCALLSLSAVSFQSCADSGRGPTSPSPVAQLAPRSLSWECLHQGIGSGGQNGWSFATPAVDCGQSSAPVPDVAVGMVTAAPGNFRSTVTGSTVRLEWNPIFEAVTSFLIEAGSGPALANLARFDTGSATPALVVNNVPNGVYYVRVRAIGPDSLPGPASNEIVVPVGRPLGGAPEAPTGFTAQVQNNQVNLSWTAPAAGDSVSTYVIEAGSVTGLNNIVAFDTGNASTQLSATAPDGRYYVRIRGRNSAGVGPPSNEVTIDVPGGVIIDGLCDYNVSPISLTAAAAGGAIEVNVNVTGTNPADCRWNAASNSGFISLNSSDASRGPGAARFSVAANPGSSRQGSVRISWDNGQREVTISQGGIGDTCVYLVSPTSLTPSHTAGNFSVDVTPSRGDCAWSASSSGFLNLAAGGASIGTGSVRFNFLENGSAAPRNATARVSWSGGSQDISVAQAGRPPDPPVQTPPIDNVVTVQPPDGGGMARTEPTPPPQTCRANAGCIAINPPSATRNGAGLLTLLLESVPGDPRSAAADATNAFDGAIITNAASFSGGTPQASSHIVVSFPTPRTSATVTIATLTQSPSLQVGLTRNSQPPLNYLPVSTPNCSYTLTPPPLPLPAGGGSFDVGVVTTAGCAWTATAGSSIVSVTTGSGTGSGTARFSATANTSPTSRSTTVTIGGQALTISQAGSASCSFTVTPPTVNVMFLGGQFSLTITPAAGSSACSWTATPLQSFITVASGGSGIGSGTATFNVAQLASPSARSGVVRVSWAGGSSDVGVVQSPPSCFYSTPSTSLSLGGSATTFTVPITVTMQPGTTTCAPWSVSSLSSFMTVTSSGPFSGSGQTTVNLAANTTGASRVGTIRVSFGGSFFDISVTQAIVSPSSFRGSLSGTAVLQFGGPPYCYYSQQFTNLTAQMTFAGTALSAAELTATGVELALFGCPYPSGAPNTHRYVLQSYSFDATNSFLQVTYQQVSGTPAARLTFSGTKTSGGVTGTFRFVRTDQAGFPTLTWTIDAIISLTLSGGG